MKSKTLPTRPARSMEPVHVSWFHHLSCLSNVFSESRSVFFSNPFCRAQGSQKKIRWNSECSMQKGAQQQRLRMPPTGALLNSSHLVTTVEEHHTRRLEFPSFFHSSRWWLKQILMRWFLAKLKNLPPFSGGDFFSNVWNRTQSWHFCIFPICSSESELICSYMQLLHLCTY